jgi:hypothetical protein
MQWLREFGHFIGDMFHHWVGQMTGPLSIILAVAPVVTPHFFEGDAGLIHNRWIWWAAAALSFIVASRLAWDQQRHARLEVERQLRMAQEELADRYPRLKGEIVLGYLDIGKRYEKDCLLIYEGDCVATFYLRVVNHSNQDAFIALPPALKLTINGRDYVVDYVTPASNTLTVNDSELKGDRHINDFFGFGTLLGMGVFQKPRLHPGWLMFNLPDSQVYFDGQEHVAGLVSIALKDTLGGIHPISSLSPEIEFRLNKIMPQ